jgi:DNA-binding IclR family transcriptional regulator
LSIRSVLRALSVLDCFTPKKQRLSLHEISETIKLAKSTTFRILQTLVDAGYLIQTDSMHYSLSLRVLRLGNCILPNLGVREIARPEMYLVNEVTKETVALSEYLPTERVIIDVVESALPLKLVLRTGESVQQDAGATGQVYLAYHPDSLSAYLKKHKNDRDQIQKQIDDVQTKGYAFTTGSRAPGSCGVAVAVFDINNECKYSIGVYGPDTRVKPNLDMIVQTLKDSANRISVRLGSTTLLK